MRGLLSGLGPPLFKRPGSSRFLDTKARFATGLSKIAAGQSLKRSPPRRSLRFRSPARAIPAMASANLKRPRRPAEAEAKDEEAT